MFRGKKNSEKSPIHSEENYSCAGIRFVWCPTWDHSIYWKEPYNLWKETYIFWKELLMCWHKIRVMSYTLQPHFLVRHCNTLQHTATYCNTLQHVQYKRDSTTKNTEKNTKCSGNSPIHSEKSILRSKKSPNRDLTTMWLRLYHVLEK